LEEALLKDETTPLALVKIDCEDCELHFLRGARSVLKKWDPAMIVEIQNDETRQKARLGGQRMIVPTDTRDEIEAGPENIVIPAAAAAAAAAPISEAET
jgi:hypothetical protein